MKVSEIMTRGVEIASPDDTIQQAASRMAELDAGVLPVGENDRLVGMLTDRDIAIRVVAEGRNGAVVRDVMSSSVRTCRESDNVEDVMRVMADEQVRRIPIVDESGAVVGIVSQADIVREGSDKHAEQTIEQISQPGGSHNT